MFDELKQETGRLEAIYEQKLAALEALKKSLLHQAFTGKLVELSMNEAETRAEHIDPALKAAGWGVVEGSRIRREYSIAPGRIEGQGEARQPLTRRLRAGVPQHQARGRRSQGLGQAS